MLQSLYSGISALRSHQQMLGVVSNNLSNVNTTAYKGSRTLFQDTLSQTLSFPTQSSATQAGKNGIQIGLGVGLSAVTPIFAQGSLQSTGLPTDVAIEGDGFLVVRDPASTTGGYYYTRAGALRLDSNGFLVDTNGFRVQGYGFHLTDSDPGAGVTPAFTTPTSGAAYEDIQISTSLLTTEYTALYGGAPPVGTVTDVVSFSIEASGRILAKEESGVTVPIGYLGMTKFSNPEALLRSGSNLFTETPASGLQFVGYQEPGTSGLGRLRGGFLEMSNVDLGTEFTDMIRSQRGLQANSRVITSSDEVLQELINLKR